MQKKFPVVHPSLNHRTVCIRKCSTSVDSSFTAVTVPLEFPTAVTVPLEFPTATVPLEFPTAVTVPLEFPTAVL